MDENYTVVDRLGNRLTVRSEETVRIKQREIPHVKKISDRSEIEKSIEIRSQTCQPAMIARTATNDEITGSGEAN